MVDFNTKKFFYSLYYGIYSLNNGYKTSTHIIPLLITLNVYPILKFFIGSFEGAMMMSIGVDVVASTIMLIIAVCKEDEIIEYCEQRPADYAMYAWAYIIISVLVVILTRVM
jgi:hypothetical protein